MNPKYLGDSYDLVKRFFCRELISLGYKVSIDPLFTGDWGGQEEHFYRLIGSMPNTLPTDPAAKSALFLDPDTGVRERDGRSHVTFDRIARELTAFRVVFSFDQAFSRQDNARAVMHKKLTALSAHNCHGMYYDSHARFLFAAKTSAPLFELRAHLIGLGLPSSRLICGEA